MSTFCKNCRFYEASELRAYARCTASVRTDLVTGREEYPFCSMERIWGACGDEGKLFQPKHLPLREQLVRSLEVTPLAGTVQ